MFSFLNFLYILITAVLGEKNLLQFIRAFDAPMVVRIEIERYHENFRNFINLCNLDKIYDEKLTISNSGQFKQFESTFDKLKNYGCNCHALLQGSAIIVNFSTESQEDNRQVIQLTS